MFKWLGQRLEKKERKTRQLPESEIYISPVFKWLGRRPESREKKTKRLWEREFKIVRAGLDEKQVISFVDDLVSQNRLSQGTSSMSLRSLLQTAIADAEQIADSIKMRAETEAKAETARIISQAEQDAQEIKRRAEVATQKEAEGILSVANRKAEITEVEAKQKALLFLLRVREEIEKEVRAEYERAYSRLSSSLQNLVSEGENIEAELKSKRAALWENKAFELKEHEAMLLKSSEGVMSPLETPVPMEAEIESDIASKEKIEQPVLLQEEAPEEGMEQPVQLQEEPPQEIEEPVRLQDEVLEEKVEESTQVKLDSQASYTGEVELVIAMPVELKTVSKLYNYLQTIPEIKILRTRGYRDRGTTITVVLDEPIPLISIMSKIPGVEVIPELIQEDSLVKGSPSSLPRVGEKGAKRIKLTLREA